MSERMTVLSFDPASYRNLGGAVALIQKGQSVQIEVAATTFVLSGTSEEPWTSLWPLFNVVDTFISENDPDLVVVEKTSSFAGGFITGQVSNCLGVILACCGKHELPVEFVYPTHVKKVVTGKGKATKTEMKNSVSSVLKQLKSQTTKFDSEHAYDAVANILTYMHESDDINFKIG
jgi:Holliday junction resolvasome RuvABC endonuclease subunit